MKYNTIDIDYPLNTFHFLIRVFNKINGCKHLSSIFVSESLNGFHIRLYCKIECEICRLIYDDQKRYAYDQFRPLDSQNVLWNRKKLRSHLTTASPQSDMNLKTGEANTP